jgi:hypothetical protein
MKVCFVLCVFVVSVFADDFFKNIPLVMENGHVLGTTPPNVKCQRNSKGMCARGFFKKKLNSFRLRRNFKLVNKIKNNRKGS